MQASVTARVQLTEPLVWGEEPVKSTVIFCLSMVTAVLIIVTVGAAATPSGDPLTLLLLSVPLYLLYEIDIWLVRLVFRR